MKNKWEEKFPRFGVKKTEVNNIYLYGRTVIFW